MSASPTLTWEQYQQLPPQQRRRPLTDTEYAALTKQQRIAGGLDENDQGAPANFNGPVFPNPTHIQPHADTDAPIDPTRLPEGASFQRGNWSGTPQMDISNPAAADVQPEMGREVGADFSAKGNVSSAATVPVFSPDGTLGDIPADQLTMAAKAGAKPGVHIIAPDGSAGVVPADHMRDAVQAGAKIVPIQDQPIQHPGFWATLGSDLGGMAKGAWHAGVDPLTDTHEDLVRKLHAEQAADQAAENSPERQAHGALYRNVGVPAAEAVGVNVPGMEQSAAEGDVAGVAGHAAAPVAAAAITSGIGKLGGAVGEAVDAAASSPTVKAAVTAAAKKLPAAAIRRIPYVGDVAADVYHAGSEAAAKAKGAAAAPELDATSENKPYAGEPAPKPAPVLDSTGENKPFAGGMDEYTPPKPKAPRTIVRDPQTGRPEFSDVVAAKQQAATPVETKAPQTETPAAQPLAKGTPAETPGPAADDLLARLGKIKDRLEKQEAAAPGSADEDLIQQGKDSLDLLRAKKATAIPEPRSPGETLDQFNQRLSDIADRKAAAAGGKSPGGASSAATAPENGVMTTASPKDLLGRWGVDEDSFAQGREQTRGMKPDESAAAVADMTKRFKNGQAVDPVMETRDADNNIVDVDGRGRALAAHKAGVERIPIIVRRLQPVGTAQ